MDPAPTEEASSTLASEFGAGLIGAGIALGCVLPPLLHLLTGPLGPFIGGFVAANRSRPGARGIAIIALTVGTIVAGFIGGVATIVSNLSRSGGGSELPTFLQPLVKGPAFVAIVAVVWVYASSLSAGGAYLRGVMAKGKESSASS